MGGSFFLHLIFDDFKISSVQQDGASWIKCNCFLK